MFCHTRKKTTAFYVESVATFLKQNLMFADLYIFECVSLFTDGVSVCEASMLPSDALPVEEHKSLYVDR